MGKMEKWWQNWVKRGEMGGNGGKWGEMVGNGGLWEITKNVLWRMYKKMFETGWEREENRRKIWKFGTNFPFFPVPFFFGSGQDELRSLLASQYSR